MSTGATFGIPIREILAIDPGTEQSGFVRLGLFNEFRLADRRVLDSGVIPNEQMLWNLRTGGWNNPRDTTLAIEMIASYGMPVGREVFETCVWIGRFVQAWHDPSAVRRIFRQTVKLHVCGSPRAKDPNVRQALLDLFPATGGGKTPQVGTKGQPGPLYGVSSHAWAALGVAVTVAGFRQHDLVQEAA